MDRGMSHKTHGYDMMLSYNNLKERPTLRSTSLANNYLVPKKVPTEKTEAVTATSSINGNEEAHELPLKFPCVSQ